MIKEFTWKLAAPLILTVPAPRDRYPDPTSPVLMSGGDHFVWVCDPTVETYANGYVAGSGGTLTVPVDSVEGWAVGDYALLSADDGSLAGSDIEVISTPPNQLEFSAGTLNGTSISAFKRVIKLLTPMGAAITGVEFGTPAADTITWGYTAAIPASYKEMSGGKQLLIESRVSLGTAVIPDTWNVLIRE